MVIGVAGANYHALPRQTLFATQDRDLFLPLEPRNELAALETCRALGLELSAGDEAVEEPLDVLLAERIVTNRATVRAHSAGGLDVDLNLLMAGFEFDQVWRDRTHFAVEGVTIPVASLEHIVESKRTAGRSKDLLFLREHRDVLEQILKRKK